MGAQVGSSSNRVPLRPSAPRGLSLVPVAAPALPQLLAFADTRTLERHSALLGEWSREVEKEGRFAVQWVYVPRVEHWTSSNRVSSVMALLAEVQRRDPAAVMLWGSVGWIGTGSYDPDGHGPRVAWTDVPFASDHRTWTDTRDFGISYPLDLGRNAAGDGRFDQTFDGQASIRARRSVGRVDFSGLKSTRAVSDVGEDAAMEDYLRRNLAYRRGQGFTNEVVFLGSRLPAANLAWIRTNVVGRPVREISAADDAKVFPVAGQRPLVMYTSIVPYLREGFRDAKGTPTSSLWVVVDHSSAGDPWNVEETARQYLRQSLVVTCGGAHWLPNGATVREAYLKHSYAGTTCLVAEDTLLGDVTLTLP
ncbi:MAG: hypothetical protein JNL97_01905 [Verrucomicrobiales bacterium]|nr:hypothetical protein [Verrucomicrobiales bacterium]